MVSPSSALVVCLPGKGWRESLGSPSPPSLFFCFCFLFVCLLFFLRSPAISLGFTTLG